jgi:hypothetical protein
MAQFPTPPQRQLKPLKLKGYSAPWKFASLRKREQKGAKVQSW